MQGHNIRSLLHTSHAGVNICKSMNDSKKTSNGRPPLWYSGMGWQHSHQILPQHHSISPWIAQGYGAVVQFWFVLILAAVAMQILRSPFCSKGVNSHLACSLVTQVNSQPTAIYTFVDLVLDVSMDWTQIKLFTISLNWVQFPQHKTSFKTIKLIFAIWINFKSHFHCQYTTLCYSQGHVSPIHHSRS